MDATYYDYTLQFDHYAARWELLAMAGNEKIAVDTVTFGPGEDRQSQSWPNRIIAGRGHAVQYWGRTQQSGQVATLYATATEVAR